MLKRGGRAVLSTAGAHSAARLESVHREAAERLGNQPTGRVVDRFNGAIVAREGVFRDPKPAGCFVVTKT